MEGSVNRTVNGEQFKRIGSKNQSPQLSDRVCEGGGRGAWPPPILNPAWRDRHFSRSAFLWFPEAVSVLLDGNASG
ncbi:hypothetical protein AOLI_G00034980 [Acnodon oligacanthus]